MAGVPGLEPIELGIKDRGIRPGGFGRKKSGTPDCGSRQALTTVSRADGDRKPWRRQNCTEATRHRAAEMQRRRGLAHR